MAEEAGRRGDDRSPSPVLRGGCNALGALVASLSRNLRGPTKAEGVVAEEIVLGMLELALALCTATSDDCLNLAEAAVVEDLFAVYQLGQLVKRAGLLGRVPLDGAEPVELSRNFLGTGDRKDPASLTAREASRRRVSFKLSSSKSSVLSEASPPRKDLRLSSSKSTVNSGGSDDSSQSSWKDKITTLATKLSLFKRRTEVKADGGGPVEDFSSGRRAQPSPKDEELGKVPFVGPVCQEEEEPFEEVPTESLNAVRMQASVTPVWSKAGVTDKGFGEKQRLVFRTRQHSKSSEGSGTSCNFSETSFMDFNRRRLEAQQPVAPSNSNASQVWQPLRKGAVPVPSRPPVVENNEEKVFGPVDPPLPAGSVFSVASVNSTGSFSASPTLFDFIAVKRAPLIASRRSKTASITQATAQQVGEVTSVKFRLPEGGFEQGLDNLSEDLVSYYSAADAIVVAEGDGDGDSQILRTSVNFVQSGGAANEVQIQFRSDCLRTQNAWQRQLLREQKALLETVSTKLEDAEQSLRKMDEVAAEEKELLRGFRKIVTREHKEQLQQLVEVIIIEEDKAVASELESMCQILDFSCEVYPNVQALKIAQEAAVSPTAPTPSKFRRSSTSKSSLGSRASSWSRTSRSSQSSDSRHNSVKVIFLGAGQLKVELPEEWKKEDSPFYLALTSMAEEFEDVGRTLLAAGEAEIRSRLRSRGIKEYLLHPLSLENIQGVALAALKQATGNEYLLTKVIGRGTFGVVYRAKRMKDGEVFALKEVNAGRLSRKDVVEMEQETELLKNLDWPTVVFLVDAWVAREGVLRYLLMPLADGGDVERRLQEATRADDPKEIPQELQCAWFAQVLHGLLYLHHNGVLHRDLKPSNLLLDQDYRGLQISDLGSAGRLPGYGPHPIKRSCVIRGPATGEYSAPEVVLQKQYLTGSDMWAAGVTFYEVIMHSPLFPEDSAIEIVQDAMRRHKGPKGTLEAQGPIEAAIVDLQAIVGPSAQPPSRWSLRPRPSVPLAAWPQMAQDVIDMLHPDPLSRPTAASLVARESTIQQLREVLSQAAPIIAESDEALEGHLEDVARVLEESAAAENLEPPSGSAYDPASPELSTLRNSATGRKGKRQKDKFQFDSS